MYHVIASWFLHYFCHS